MKGQVFHPFPHFFPTDFIYFPLKSFVFPSSENKTIKKIFPGKYLPLDKNECRNTRVPNIVTLGQISFRNAENNWFPCFQRLSVLYIRKKCKQV